MLMSDPKAQAQAPADSSAGQNITITRKSLRELIKSLASSVSLLQGAIELDDLEEGDASTEPLMATTKDEEAELDDKMKVTTKTGTQEVVEIAATANVASQKNETVANDEPPPLPRITILSKEEVERQNLADLKHWDESCKDLKYPGSLTIDSWKNLNRDNYFCATYPELCDDEYRLRVLKRLHYGLSRSNLGQVLDHLYRHGILLQPSHDEFGIYVYQVDCILHVLNFINLWYPLNHELIPLWTVSIVTTTAGLRKLKISELCLHARKGAVIDACERMSTKADGSSFTCSEMSCEVLRKVGKLKVEWTALLDEHLLLDAEKRLLQIFWFGFTIQDCPVFHIGCRKFAAPDCHWTKLSPVYDELERIYSLLFRSGNGTYEENLAEYGLLPIPSWLRDFYASELPETQSQAIQDMSYVLQLKDMQVSDVKDHIKNLKRRLPPTQSFEQYVIWGGRLRMIKAYMDNQKPKGLRGLWIDRRDNTQWHTFWAVVIVGSVSILLTIIGLVVSIAQTVGTFKGLEQ